MKTITMTKTKALAIQAQQVEHYVGFYGPTVRDLVAAATNADLIPDDQPRPVWEINRAIPRGFDIEQLLIKAKLKKG